MRGKEEGEVNEGGKQTCSVVNVHLSESMLCPVNQINNKVGIFVITLHNNVGTTVKFSLCQKKSQHTKTNGTNMCNLDG